MEILKSMETHNCCHIGCISSTTLQSFWPHVFIAIPNVYGAASFCRQKKFRKRCSTVPTQGQRTARTKRIKIDQVTQNVHLSDELCAIEENSGTAHLWTGQNFRAQLSRKRRHLWQNLMKLSSSLLTSATDHRNHMWLYSKGAHQEYIVCGTFLGKLSDHQKSWKHPLPPATKTGYG